MVIIKISDELMYQIIEKLFEEQKINSERQILRLKESIKNPQNNFKIPDFKITNRKILPIPEKILIKYFNDINEHYNSNNKPSINFISDCCVNELQCHVMSAEVDDYDNYIVRINDLILKTNYYTYDSKTNKFIFVN